jgi:hypothetical protein
MTKHLRNASTALTVAAVLAACGKEPASDAANSGRTLAELDSAVTELQSQVAKLRENQGEWVLWRTTMTPDTFQNTPPYLVEAAYGEKTSCTAAAQDLLKSQRRPQDVAVGELTFQATDPKGHRIIYGFLCLPKAVDPKLQR